MDIKDGQMISEFDEGVVEIFSVECVCVLHFVVVGVTILGSMVVSLP